MRARDSLATPGPRRAELALLGPCENPPPFGARTRGERSGDLREGRPGGDGTVEARIEAVGLVNESRPTAAYLVVEGLPRLRLVGHDRIRDVAREGVFDLVLASHLGDDRIIHLEEGVFVRVGALGDEIIIR